MMNSIELDLKLNRNQIECWANSIQLIIFSSSLIHSIQYDGDDGVGTSDASDGGWEDRKIG